MRFWHGQVEPGAELRLLRRDAQAGRCSASRCWPRVAIHMPRNCRLGVAGVDVVHAVGRDDAGVAAGDDESGEHER